MNSEVTTDIVNGETKLRTLNLFDKAELAMDILEKLHTEYQIKIEKLEAHIIDIQNEMAVLLDGRDVSTLDVMDWENYDTLCLALLSTRFNIEFCKKIIDGSMQVFIDMLSF